MCKVSEMPPAFSQHLLYLNSGGVEGAFHTCTKTVPANKKAMVCYPLRTNVTAYYLNLSGSNKNITCNFVNSGGSISTNNQFLPSKLVPNNSMLATIPGSESAFASLSAGDFVNITVSATTATQTAWVTVYEV